MKSRTIPGLGALGLALALLLAVPAYGRAGTETGSPARADTIAAGTLEVMVRTFMWGDNSRGALTVDDYIGKAYVPDQMGRRATFTCPGPAPVLGGAWGTDIYAGKSPICQAAIHAGVISAQTGGDVTIEIRPGQSSYVGTQRNGGWSFDLGAWPTSFVVIGGALVPTAATSIIEWDANAVSYRGQTGQQLSFQCPAGGTVGSVWGTGTYTDDSSICTAAVHAGAISPVTGGLVRIEIRPGQDGYAPSVSNGVTSQAYGAWQGSFVVIRRIGGPARTQNPTEKVPVVGGGQPGAPIP